MAVCGVGQQHCHWGARYALVRDGPCETVARASVVQNSFAQLFEGNRAGSPNCVPRAQHRRRWDNAGIDCADRAKLRHHQDHPLEMRPTILSNKILRGGGRASSRTWPHAAHL